MWPPSAKPAGARSPIRSPPPISPNWAVPTASSSTCGRTAGTSRTATCACSRRPCSPDCTWRWPPPKRCAPSPCPPCPTWSAWSRKNEGGLNLLGREKEIRDYLAPLHQAGIVSSLFIDADPYQIDAAKETGAEYIEIHTGHFADAATTIERERELARILAGVVHARDLDLKVNLGHGLNYTNIHAFSRTPTIQEYSIGHSIISRSIAVGLQEAVAQMDAIIRGFLP
jgi:hypothetical protein